MRSKDTSQEKETIAVIGKQRGYSGKLGIIWRRYNNTDMWEAKGDGKRMVASGGRGAGRSISKAIRKGWWLVVWFHCLLFLCVCSPRNPFLGARLPNNGVARQSHVIARSAYSKSHVQ